MIDQYTEPEDFLMDDTFKQYCEGSNQKCILFWEAWLAKNPEKRKTAAKAKRLHQILSGNLKPVHEQLTFLKNEISKETVIRKGNFKWYSIAASFFIILLAGLFYFYYQNPAKPIIYTETYIAQKGEKKRIILADGTLVHLNSDSKIELGEGFNKKSRNIRLTGEAFFDVARNANRPFKVLTRWFKITVLGTSFNVKSYAAEKKSEATLVKGVIQLEDNEVKGNSLIIKRGQKIIYTPAAKVHESNHDLPAAAVQALPKLEVVNLSIFDNKVVESAWVDNDMIFSNNTFLEIKPLIERWFNTEIVFNDKEVEKYSYTARFKNEDLNTVLLKLQQVKHFDFKKKGGRIIIYK